eukprot:2271072-Rhodomonas_salina.2
MADDRVVWLLVTHHAHVTVPQDYQYFCKHTPEMEGVHVLRVDADEGDGNVRCTVVRGPWTEVGKEVSFPYRAVDTENQVTPGLQHLIRGQWICDVCQRGEEWVWEDKLWVNALDWQESPLHRALHQFWKRN